MATTADFVRLSETSEALNAARRRIQWPNGMVRQSAAAEDHAAYWDAFRCMNAARDVIERPSR